MPELSEGEFKKELSRDTLRSLYVLYGEEKFLVRSAARRLIEKASGEAFSEFNRNEFPATASVDAVADAALALPVFSEHKCVAVSDLPVEELDAIETGKLFELFDTLPETTTLVLWFPTEEQDLRRPGAKLRNFLKKAGETGGLVAFRTREDGDLLRRLMHQAEKNGCILERPVAKRIIDYAGRDVTLLSHELEKLCAFTLGQGTQTITRETVDAMTYRNTEVVIFQMGDALMAGRYEDAFLYLDTLLSQNEEPVVILSTLASAYIDMYRIQTALESGMTASDAALFGEYKGREFRLRNASRNLRGMRSGVLQESLNLLLDADITLKSSRLSARIVLEELIARLLLTAKGERAS